MSITMNFPLICEVTPCGAVHTTHMDVSAGFLTLMPVFAGEAPPRQAYGALIAGYARMRDIDGALATLRKFHSVGGVPDSRMFDVLIDVCIKQGEFKRALQVQHHFYTDTIMLSVSKGYGVEI